MRILARLTIATAVLATSLALLAASASANRSLSASPGGAIRATSEGKLTFDEPGEGFGLACNLTFNGTLERVVAKRAGAHVASLTEGRTNECRDTVFASSGSAVVLVEARSPFDVVYSSFLGTLPRISGIVVRADMRFLLTTAIGSCLFSTEARARETTTVIDSVAETGSVTRGHFVTERSRLLTRLSGTCPAAGALAGSFSLTPTQTVRLL